MGVCDVFMYCVLCLAAVLCCVECRIGGMGELSVWATLLCSEMRVGVFVF